jgi:hypothetical protein
MVNYFPMHLNKLYPLSWFWKELPLCCALRRFFRVRAILLHACCFIPAVCSPSPAICRPTKNTTIRCGTELTPFLVLKKTPLMKKFYVAALLGSALFVFPSFRAKSPMHHTISHKGSTTSTVHFPLCSGDYVLITMTDDYEVHGVVNNNRAMLNVKHHFTGSGNSILSGENYTINTEIETHGNVPVSKGAMVMRESINDDIAGDQGGLQNVTIRSQVVYNAKGAMIVDKFVVTPTCR